MGNKPSLEKAFDSANQVFHEYQRAQKDQQQPQYNQPYPGNHSQPYPQQPAHGGGQHQQQSHQQPHNQHYNNQGAPHAPSPHLDEGDDPEYTRLRGLAHKEATTRNECYERSQQAYKSGDGAQGKNLNSV
jgi:Domain of unknown function (DUF1771)